MSIDVQIWLIVARDSGLRSTSHVPSGRTPSPPDGTASFTTDELMSFRDTIEYRLDFWTHYKSFWSIKQVW